MPIPEVGLGVVMLSHIAKLRYPRYKPRMSKEVQALFTSIAKDYDFLNHFLSFSIDKRWRNKAIAALGTAAPGKVLDLCAGTLDLTLSLLKKFPQSQVTAADFSLAMLEEAAGKIIHQKNVHRVCADGHRLPFVEKTFEVVLCAFGIRNLEDRESAAAEIRRVLKKGGRLIVLEFFRPEKLFPRLFYQTYGKVVLPKLGGAISKNPEAYQYLQDSIAHFLTVEEYCRLLKKHGFSAVEILPLSGGIAHRVVARG